MTGTNLAQRKLEELPVRVTFNPFALAAAQKTAETELAALLDCTIEDDEDARMANDELRLRVVELDAVERMWKETKAPIKELEKRVDALFETGVKGARACVLKLRSLLEGYEKFKREAQRKALTEAAKVATQSSPAALHTALAAAADAAPTKLEGTSFVRSWVVKRIVEGMLPFNAQDPSKQFWTPDLKKIEAIGKAHKGDEPPYISGVVWEESLSSRVRR